MRFVNLHASLQRVELNFVQKVNWIQDYEVTLSAATVGPLDKLITGAQPKLLEQIQKVILLGRLTFMHLSREYAWTRKRFDLFWLSDILGLKAMELDKVQGWQAKESPK